MKVQIEEQRVDRDASDDAAELRRAAVVVSSGSSTNAWRPRFRYVTRPSSLARPEHSQVTFRM